MKELHIYLDLEGIDINPGLIFTTFPTSDAAAKSDADIVHTTQLACLSFEYGRKLLVHYQGKIHEITKGRHAGYKRCIKPNHNLQKLLINGDFDWYEKE